MSSILDAIAVDKRKHISRQRKRVSEQSLLDTCKQGHDIRDFVAALSARTSNNQTAIIAEVKKASPSRGVIRADFDPLAIALSYQQTGATCLSVLTDMPYFQGSDRYLEDISHKVRIPVLRKDFMLDPYQVLEAKALGADAILIILAMVDDELAADLCAAAREHKLAILPEVHNLNELNRALRLDTHLLGINNRDLHTFQTSLETSLNLLPYIPEDRIVITESGIQTRFDIEKMQAANIYGFLVGESLIRQPDPGLALAKLLS
ncbi:MAG: indole-3-glycerol phosphate synthase TrpC [Mariprofundaceae bacterium]